jgi:hypothetical protein
LKPAGEIDPYGFRVGGQAAVYSNEQYAVSSAIDVLVSMALEVVVLGGIGPGVLHGSIWFNDGAAGVGGAGVVLAPSPFPTYQYHSPAALPIRSCSASRSRTP